MSKRARYDGPHLEVAIFDPEASVYAEPVAVVQKGHLVPSDVPARIRDELLSRADFSEVQDTSGQSTAAKKE